MVKKSSELYIKCPDGEYAELPMVLQRQIEIKNEYLGFILALAYDYDGFNTVEGLKGLIDGLSKYARYALDNNDKIPIYRNTNGDDFNILHEKIGE